MGDFAISRFLAKEVRTDSGRSSTMGTWGCEGIDMSGYFNSRTHDVCKTGVNDTRFERAGDIVGSIAFLAISLPCFLSLTFSERSLQASEPFEAFMIAAMVGCVLGSGLSIVLGAVRVVRLRLDAPFIALATISFAGGYLVPILAQWIDVPLWVLYPAGLLSGMGFVPLAIAWCLRIRTNDFRKILLGGAGLCSAAVVANQLLLHCPPAIASLAYLAMLAICPLVPLRASLENALVFPVYDEHAVDNVKDGAFVTKASLGDLALLLAGSTLGLMLFTLLSNSRHFLLIRSLFDILPDNAQQFMSEASFGLLCASFIIALGCLVKRGKPIMPFVYWVLFPAVAGILIVLDSFPSESFVFLIGATGVFVFSSLLGLFAVAFLLTASRQGEFSPLLILGIPLALVALAGLAGYAFYLSGFDYLVRGKTLLVVSTFYFVYLLVMPALQLWHARNAAQLEEPEASVPSNEEAMSSRCRKLADKVELSPREYEVLCYLGRGYNSPYIAKTLFISDSTVRSHLKSIYKKTGVSSRMELIDLLEHQA